jgi:hypothetical protein
VDPSPRILLWNYSYEEMLAVDLLLQTVSAPLLQAIERDQGNLPVHEILFTDKRSDKPFSCDEKVMLFFNVPARTIHDVMDVMKKGSLPRPIYAAVTRESIEWTFSDLVDHLVKERDFIRKRMEEEKKKNTCPHAK